MAPPESGKSIYMREQTASTFSLKISPVVTECSEEVRELDMSTRNCMFPDEQHIKYFNTYTLQGCLVECRMKWLIDKCKCHPYFYDFKQGKYINAVII
jgi:amiloride-sensitive sodium channel